MRTLTLCSFLIVATVTAGCDRPGMVVTVANESARELVDVGLKFRNKGAESLHAFGRIPRQQTQTSRIVFDAESNLVLVFRDAHGTPHSEQIPIPGDSAAASRDIWNALRNAGLDPRVDAGHSSGAWTTPHINVNVGGTNVHIPITPW